MKTRTLILIGIIITLAVSTVLITLVYNQEIKLALGIIQSQTPNYDYVREGRIEEYCIDWCNQDELYSLGCDKPMLEHLYTYSNLFDKEFDGNYVIASQCIGGITLEENYKSYDYIFSGRVESIDYSQAPTNVTLWVYNTWKGNTTQYMSVAELFPKDPLLDFLFVEGQDYLIFSSSDNRINMSTVNGCSPSGSLKESHDIVMQLEEITNYTNSKKPCNSDRVACYADQIVCDRSGWECGNNSKDIFEFEK